MKLLVVLLHIPVFPQCFRAAAALFFSNAYSVYTDAAVCMHLSASLSSASPSQMPDLQAPASWCFAAARQIQDGTVVEEVSI